MYVSYPKPTTAPYIGFYIHGFPILPSSQSAWVTSTVTDNTKRYDLALTSSRLYSISHSGSILQISQFDLSSGEEEWTHQFSVTSSS